MSPLYMVCGRPLHDEINHTSILTKLYCIILIPERVESAAFLREKAILLGRTGGHGEALQLLVHQEGDLRAAEAYCSRAGRDAQARQTLLLTLLQIYLGSEDHGGAAVDLLNRNPRVLAAERVVQLLPDSWSVQLVSQFLVGSLRETFHRRRMAMLQKAIGQVELLRHKVIWVSLCDTSYFVCILVSFLLSAMLLSLLRRCRPQKQSSNWIRGSSVMFVRETWQSHRLPVTSLVT